MEVNIMPDEILVKGKIVSGKEVRGGFLDEVITSTLNDELHTIQ